MTYFAKTSWLGVCLVLAAAGCRHHGRTLEVRTVTTQEGLRVAGQGEARGQPDVARATLGVEARAASASEATESVSRSMRQVIDALKAQGVADRDVQTEQVSVYFEQHRPLPPGHGVEPSRGDQEPPSPPGLQRGLYRASNTVRVTIRDLDKVSDLLGAATAAGANVQHGLVFELDDPTPLLEQAREKAVGDARRQAEQLAALTGMQLGPVVSISTEPHHGFPRPMRTGLAMDVAERAAVPVERGELVVQQQVEMVFALQPTAE